ncbi:MAG: hypothetical protein K0B37_02070 [Bacteroidales bacterium]|nr:hypothetical protein [Bacteroidales bacterium]
MLKPFIKLLVLIFALFYCNIGAAQILEETSQAADHEPRVSGELIYHIESTVGNQYFLNNWVIGEIILASDEKIYCNNLNYNGYVDELIWVHPEFFQHIIIDRYNVKEFTLEDKNASYRFTNLGLMEEEDLKDFNFYAQILYKGNFKLYAHRKVSRVGSDNIVQNKKNVRRTRVNPTPVYYLQMPGSEMLSFRKLNRRELMLAFPDHRREIRQALRSNRIQLFDENTFVRAMPLLENILSDKVDE